MKGIFERKGSVIGIAIFCSILWGSAFPSLKISYEVLQLAPDDIMAKITFAGMRFLLAGVLILVFLLFVSARKLLVTKRQFFVLLILGLVQTTILYFFFYNGLAKVTGMKGAILASSGTFFTIIFAHYYYQNDRLDWKKTIGLITGFAGIVLANWGQEFGLSFQWDGEGYMIMTGVVNGVATIMAKELAAGIHPFAVTGWQLVLGALVLLMIGMPQLGEGAIVFTPAGYGLLLYLAFLSAAAFALWYSLLKYNHAGEISMYKFVVPVAGTLLSAFFIPGEEVTPLIFFSIILVAGGIVAVNYHPREKKTAINEQQRKEEGLP